MHSALSRRRFLQAAAFAPLGLRIAVANADFAGPIRVGAFTVTPLRDGFFPLQASAIPPVDSEAGRMLVQEAGRPADGPWPIPVNGFLIRRAGRHWLLDAGCGTALGPDYDRLTAALATEGVRPEQVETIWLTHLHADHAGGLLAPDRSARFPNAEIVLQAREAAYWSDEGARARAPVSAGPLFDTAQASLRAYVGRTRQISGEVELAPGVHTVPLPGHTPGHAGVLLEDGTDRLLIWGDVVHADFLQLPHPEWRNVFDTDQTEAIETRKRILDRAAVEGFRVAGMHLATAGRIERSVSGYALT